MADVHKIASGNVNCYIVSAHGQALLIDTGRKKQREKILTMCRAFHVKGILLTHGHLDHCQNAAYLAGSLHIPIAMSEKDRNLIPDNRAQPLSAKTLPGKMLLAASLYSFEKEELEAFAPDFYLKPGEHLHECGMDIRVIGLPGHTEGSIGFEIDEDKLFVGDALMNLLHPGVSMLYTDEGQMLSSAALIGSLGKRTVYFGHGRPGQNRKWIK
ncbi:MAG: MBL fold metallo-hydrolase [Provencibacterium sp.]|jgi:hydroxyacylglutathione hydrolase|nr:MBL fold metallo-hydrolase [Provencibacterium sp.]